MFLWLIILSVGLGFSACVQEAGSGKFNAKGSIATKYPGTMEGAKGLLQEFLKPRADQAELSRDLRPRPKDYEAVFVPEAVKQAQEGYREPWDQGKIVLGGKPHQTEVLVWSATSKQLREGTGDAFEFPGGYKVAAPYFKDGLTFYRFKFVRPGQKLGFAWDGLVYVNGHWAIFPKPWRVLPKAMVPIPNKP